MSTPEHSPDDPKHALTAETVEAVRDAIRRDGHVSFQVVSGSMEPVIMTGEKITVEPIDSVESLRTFDIVLFWNGKLLICHYFWHLNFLPGPDGSQIIITRPLAHKDGEDLPVPAQHVLGKIISHRIPFWAKVKIIFRKRFKEARKGVLS